MLPHHLSIVSMWQRVRYDASSTEPSAVVHSLYGGVMLHDASGAVFSLASWMAVVIVASIALRGMGEALSGLN